MENNEKEKNNFISKLISATKKFYKEDEITPLEGYSIEYPDNNEYYIEKNNEKYYLRNKYVLDLLSILDIMKGNIIISKVLYLHGMKN